MKISLSWLFNHIDADWRSVDVAKIVSEFNKTTAEIDNYYELKIDLDALALGHIESISQDSISVTIPEWKAQATLPSRSDAKQGASYLIKRKNSTFQWCLSTDLGASKEFIAPAVSVDEKDIQGAWKKKFQTHDWIIEVDNKSINHRPDLWSHRGLAREIAAILHLPFKKIDSFIANQPIQTFDQKAPAEKTGSFTVIVDEPALCSSYAGLELTIQPASSLLWMASALIRIDSKPIDAAVDITNYVMWDIGQPMHAFDAEKIASKTVQVHFAKNKEKITVLDGDTIELVPQDLVISDGKAPLALAGIMGGLDSGVTSKTKTIFVEAAHFDPGLLRKTSVHTKKRTEASVRFEKTLDPNQTTVAMQRYIFLAQQAKVIDAQSLKHPIIAVGKRVTPVSITLAHHFIEHCLGTKITADFITKTLSALEFGVTEKNGSYTVVVPTFRSTKDITIARDIVEEIGRFFGYANIPPQLPQRYMAPYPTSQVAKTRAIKNILAFGVQMKEVYNYALHDQEFLKILNWQPTHAAQVLSPVSENWRLLATTLVPGLLKNIHDNAANYEMLNFFELGRTWRTTDGFVQEHKQLSGIFYSKKKNIDFYDAKAEVQKIFEALSMPVTYQAVASQEYPWFAPYQTAHILHENKIIGTMGKIQQSVLHLLAPGDAFIFELNANALLDYTSPNIYFAQMSKYQPVDRDISMLVNRKTTIEELTKSVYAADTRITDVTLLDVFAKPEWPEQKSVTLRFVVTDHQQTLSKDDVEPIWNKVAAHLKALGAEIR